jgi:hypothetical protein
MPYLLQISDPDEMRVTLQLSGKYSPDILDDAKRRVVDMYREALAARYPDGLTDGSRFELPEDQLELPIFEEEE